MNIGIYVDSTGNQKLMQNISTVVNKTVLRNDIKDVSVFYDDVGYNPFDIQCGLFNATDLWHFSGTLITTSIETTKNALNIVNDIDIIYLYDRLEKVNIFTLILMAQNDRLKILCTDNETARELYRLTNVKPFGISELDNALNLIGV